MGVLSLQISKTLSSRKIPGIEGTNVAQQTHMFIRNPRKCTHNILRSIKTTQVVNKQVCIIRYVYTEVMPYGKRKC